MYNLNDEAFDQNESKVFNDGVPGRVASTFVGITPKSAEDKEKAPDFKLVFRDEKGNEANTPFWILSEGDQYFKENMARDGKRLKNLVNTLCPNSNPAPAETPKAFLENALQVLSQAAGQKCYVMATFGTKRKPKPFVQVRGFAPVIEDINTPEAETKLKPLNFENMVPVEADDKANLVQGTATQAGSAPSTNWMQ